MLVPKFAVIAVGDCQLPHCRLQGHLGTRRSGKRGGKGAWRGGGGGVAREGSASDAAGRAAGVA